MRVFLEESPGKVITLECGLSDKVKDLKLQVHKKKGYALVRQQIFKGSTELVDGKTLNDYKLGKDAKLILKLKEKDEAKTTKTSKIPEFKVSSKSTSTTITITYQSMKPGKHTVVLSHDDVTVKTSKAGEMTSQTQDHVFHGLQPATEYSLQVFTFKASGGKECVHTESVYTGPSVPEMIVSVSEINNVLVTWNSPKHGDVSYYELSLFDAKNMSSEIVSFVKSQEEERRLFFRELEPQTYRVKLCAILNDDVRSDVAEEDIDTEYFIELDKIESTKASVTLTWKSPQHDDFTQFEVSLWDATHTDRVSEPSLLDADERCYTWTYLDPGMTYTAEVVGVLSDDIQRGKVLVQIETKCEVVISGCKPSSSTIEVCWTSPNNQHFTMYEVVLHSNDGKQILQTQEILVKEENNQYSHTFEEVTPDTDYLVTVSGIFDDGTKTDTASQKVLTEKEALHLYNLRKHKDLVVLETGSLHWDQTTIQTLERAHQLVIDLHSDSRISQDKDDLCQMLDLSEAGELEGALDIISKKPYLLNCIAEDKSWSILHWAAYHNNSNILDKLLSQPNCDMDIKATGDQMEKGVVGCTALDVANMNKCQEAKELLERWKAKDTSDSVHIDEDSLIEEGICQRYVKEGLPYLLLGLAFVTDDVWNKLGVWQVSNYLELSERLFGLLTEDWAYFRTVVGRSLKPYDKACADIIQSQIDSNGLLMAILKVFVDRRIFSDINKTLAKPLKISNNASKHSVGMNASMYTEAEICLSLYSLVLHSIFLHSPEVPRLSTTTYRGVVLKQDEVKNYIKGSHFVWQNFVGCSTDLESSMKLATPTTQKQGCIGVIFIVNNDVESSWKPSNVAQFAKNTECQRLVYPAGVRFTVSNVVPGFSQKYATEIYLELM